MHEDVTHPCGWTRRRLLAAGGAGAAMVLGGPLVSSIAQAAKPTADELRHLAETVPLEVVCMYAPASNYNAVRWLAFDADLMKRIVERHWQAFGQSGDAELGEWGLAQAYIWWRTTATRDDRVRVAITGRKMAEAFRGKHHTHPAGLFWSAAFMGMEALSRGLLNALHMVPQFQSNLDRVRAENPDYFYSFATLLMAKMFYKVPAFPMSIGNLNMAQQLLDERRDVWEGRVATWYLWQAEINLIRGRRDQAYAWLDRIETEVEPVDNATAYLFDTTRVDALELKRVVESGTYDRYQWDPLLEQARSWQSLYGEHASIR